MGDEVGVDRLVRQRAGSTWCLFVDRDGVINRRVEGDYVRDRASFELLPGAVEALVALSRWAPNVVVVTNQQGVGKGLYSHEDLDDVHRHLIDTVTAAGGRIDGILVCPHLAVARCPCRKPRPGLARDWLRARPGVRAELSVMVGDSSSDLEMAGALARATGGCAALHIHGVSPRADVDPSLSFASLADLAGEVGASLEGQPA